MPSPPIVTMLLVSGVPSYLLLSLPVVIVIFGVSPGVIVFLVVHAVIWPMSRNLLDGFQAVPRIYVEAGRNMGLSGVGLLLGTYLPASMSYILSGVKVGWARAWRAAACCTASTTGAAASGTGVIPSASFSTY